MSLADAAAGTSAAIHRILAARELARLQAIKEERDRLADQRADRGLDIQEATQRSLERSRDFADANLLADQLPEGAFLAGDDPGAITMIQGGRAGLLTSTPPRPAMGPDFEGPMEGDETPQQAQVGRKGGYLKTRSQKQIDTEADDQRALAIAMQQAQDRQADNERQAARDAETERYHQGMLAKQPQGRESFDEWKQKEDYRNAHRPSASAGAPSTQQQQNEVEDAIALVDRISNDKSLPAAVGPLDGRGLGMVRDLSGVTRVDAMHKELVGKLALAQAGKLKGQGQISNMERELLANAATALTRKMKESDYKAELAKIKAQFERMRTGGAAPAGVVPMVAPDGRPLMVPADKVAEMEAKGARRR